MKRIDILAGGLMLLCGLSHAAGAERVSFRRDIAPLLHANCLACHGAKKAEGNFRVDSFQRLTRPGDSEVAVVTGKTPDESELLRRLLAEDEDERMPLESEPLAKENIELVRRWIEEGADYDGQDPTLPLLSIMPPPVHPDPPARYPSTLPVTAIEFTQDGKQLIVGGYYELTIWNLEDGKLARRVKNIGQRTYALALSKDETQLAVGCGAPGQLGETRIVDLTSGEVVKVLGKTSDVVLDVAFNPRGDRLAVAAADNLVRVFEVSTGNEQLQISSHSDWVMAVAWDQEGKRLATASRDKTAKVFQADSGQVIVTYSGHGHPVRGVAFHPDNQQVYSTGDDHKLHRWKINDGKKQGEAGFGGDVFKITSQDGFLFVTSADKSVRQFQARDQQEIRKYVGHEDWVLSAAYNAKTKRVASGGFDGIVRIWNSQDGQPVLSLIAAPGRSS